MSNRRERYTKTKREPTETIMFLACRVRFFVLILTSLLSCVVAAPSRDYDNDNIQAMKEYLTRYSPDFVPAAIHPRSVASGEDVPEDISLENNPTFADYIINFQKMANIEPTGTLDDKTMEKTKESRCGVRDHIFDPKAPGNYEILSTWNSKKDKKTGLYTMTYSLPKRDTPAGLKFQSFRKGVTLAMCSWELISNIRFKNIGIGKKTADVVISYESKNHGDGYPFDGKGGTLGHAFYPEDGRLHLDTDESWYLAKPKKEEYKKKDVYTATLHELGHILGLLHSKARDAVMAPFYRFRGTFGTFDLPKDEISGIEQMYGKRIDSNPADEKFSACREAKRKRYHHNFTVPTRPTEASTTVVVEFEEEPCEDERGRERQCPTWKSHGFCERDIFASTMLKRCKRTCGFCPGVPPVEKIEALGGPSGLGSSICDIRQFDSVVTRYDKQDGFAAFIFKDDYYFKSKVSLLPSKYSSHSLLNKTDDLRGVFRFDTDPKSMLPGIFKIKENNFMTKTEKVHASLLSGRRYFVFENAKVHVYRVDISDVLAFEKTHDTPMLFPAYPNAKVDAAHATVDEEEDIVTYTLFYGSKMWQYKEFREKGRNNLFFIPVYEKSAVDIAEWHGVPTCNLDAVFEYRGIPYFLKGNIFWPAVDTEPQVAKDITYSFFRCWQTEPKDLTIPTSCETTQDNQGNGTLGNKTHSTFLILVITLLTNIVMKHFL